MKLNELVENVSTPLIEHGYRKRGTLFIKKSPGMYKQLWYQGRKSLFTVSMMAMIELPDEEDFEPNRPFGFPHWKRRVGELLPQNQDTWWDLYDNTPDEDLVREQELILTTIALPRLEAISPEWIVGEWLNDRGTGPSLKLEKEYLQRAIAAGVKPAAT